MFVCLLPHNADPDQTADFNFRVKLFKSVRVFQSLLLHPGFFSSWSLSCTGSHGSLPIVLIRVETGHVTSRGAGYSGRLRLDHYVGSWRTHEQTKDVETIINT